jgi:hypothetical protein
MINVQCVLNVVWTRKVFEKRVVLCTALQVISKLYEDHGKVILTEKMKPDVIKFKKVLVKKKH